MPHHSNKAVQQGPIDPRQEEKQQETQQLWAQQEVRGQHVGEAERATGPTLTQTPPSQTLSATERDMCPPQRPIGSPMGPPQQQLEENMRHKEQLQTALSAIGDLDLAPLVRDFVKMSKELIGASRDVRLTMDSLPQSGGHIPAAWWPSRLTQLNSVTALQEALTVKAAMQKFVDGAASQSAPLCRGFAHKLRYVDEQHVFLIHTNTSRIAEMTISKDNDDKRRLLDECVKCMGMWGLSEEGVSVAILRKFKGRECGNMMGGTVRTLDDIRRKLNDGGAFYADTFFQRNIESAMIHFVDTAPTTSRAVRAAEEEEEEEEDGPPTSEVAEEGKEWAGSDLEEDQVEEDGPPNSEKGVPVRARRSRCRKRFKRRAIRDVEEEDQEWKAQLDQWRDGKRWARRNQRRLTATPHIYDSTWDEGSTHNPPTEAGEQVPTRQKRQRVLACARQIFNADGITPRKSTLHRMDPKDKDDAQLLKLFLCVEFRPDCKDWGVVAAANIASALGHDRSRCSERAYLEEHALTNRQCRDCRSKPIGKRADGRLVFNSRSGSGPSGPAYVIMWDYDVKRLVKDPIAVSAFVAST